MRAGQMRRRVTFQTVTETVDAAGGIQESWSDFATRWAHIKRVPTSKRMEEFSGKQWRSEADFIFTVRYDTTMATVTPKHRISYASATYNIQSIFNTEERDVELKFYTYQVQQ